MKAVIFWPILLAVVLLDVLTKSLAVTLLAPSGVPHEVIGEGARLALVYNPGAAFGLYLGAYSRWIFMALTGGALFILWRLYKHTESGDIARVLAVTFVSAGAIGNLLDRIRSDMGVVDFIDLGIGAHRWPTFNVADMAVSGGALLLAWVLWNEDKRAALVAAAAPVVAASVGATSVGATSVGATSVGAEAGAPLGTAMRNSASSISTGDAGDPS